MINADLIIAETYRGLTKFLCDPVISTAEELGYELFAVGGCVRDPLLGRSIGDIDLAVVGDAIELAEQVARRARIDKQALYRRFGTALVHFRGVNLEFAAARRESYSPDSRKPSEVQLVDIEQDLLRRDFTINALALALTGPRQGQLLDLFGGREDLSEGLIRTPGEPGRTFADDPLRMLRAVRFAAELGFQIEPQTWEGLKDSIPRLEIVAAERIGDEFWKMLAGHDPVRAMQLLIDSGLMNLILPEVIDMAGVEQVGRHHHKDVLAHSLKVLQNVAERTPDPVVRLAGLLHDVGKPRTKHFDRELGWTFHGHDALGAKMTRRLGRRLKIGKEDLERLTRLVQLHMRPINLTDEGVTDSAIRRMMAESGKYLDDQLILCRADITSANPDKVQRYLATFDEMVSRMGDVQARDRMRNFQSPLRGDEIIQLLNLEPGPVVGALKEEIEDAILDGVIPFDRDAAREYLFRIKDKIISKDSEAIAQERRIRAQSRRRIKGDFKFPEIAELNEEGLPK
ncbi:MAG: HD domain-containing protein [Calditrichota bacterium]